MKIRNTQTGEVIEKIKNPVTNKEIEITSSLAKNLCYSQHYEPADDEATEASEQKQTTFKPKKQKPGPKRGSKKQNKEAENRLTK